MKHMNELFLVIIVIGLLFGTQFILRKAKRPLLSYIKIFAAIVLLVLIWVFGGESRIFVKVILSAIALTSIFKELISLRKFHSS